jgi:hypothetical protein
MGHFKNLDIDNQEKQLRSIHEIIDNLDDFTRAYLIAALWSSVDDNDQGFDENNELRDISRDTLLQAIVDCTKFQKDNEELLSRATHDHLIYSNEEMNGHDFWLTRNHHGAGFWDREHEGTIGDDLTKASHNYCELCVYLGDDQKIYFS